jgi:hypothetical protein
MPDHNRLFPRLGTTAPTPINGSKVLRALQRGEWFVYSILTRSGAIKVGATRDLASRKHSIKFGGTERILGFMPGDLGDESRLHDRLNAVRIPGTREYYYPQVGVLPVVNEMREQMGLLPLRRRDLPRMADCTFHRRVMEAEAAGTSVFR